MSSTDLPNRPEHSEFGRLVFRWLLRVVAVVTSLAIAAVILGFVLLANIDYISPAVKRILNQQENIQVDFSKIEVAWASLKPSFHLLNLVVEFEHENFDLDLTVNSVDVKPTFGDILGGVLSVEHVALSKPRLSGTIRLDAQTEREDKSGTRHWKESAGNWLASVRRIKKIVVEDGQFNLELMTETQSLPAIGTVKFQTKPTEKGYRMKGNVDTALINQSTIDLSLNLTESSQADGVPKAEFELNAISVDMAWFDILGIPRVRFANAKTVVDASVKSNWVDGALELIEWKVNATDETLDGNIPHVEFASVKSQGKWSTPLNAKDGGQLEASVEIQSLDLATVLNTFPEAFPPKFRTHMETRLHALEMLIMTASFSGLPMQFIENTETGTLKVDGTFQNLNFTYGTNLPPLENGNGRFQIRGKRLESEGNTGMIYGEPINFFNASIEDFMVPKPIMVVDGSISFPVEKALQLFGPQGTAFPGRSKSIHGGTGRSVVDLSIRVPLREGKKFSFTGVAVPEDGVTLIIHEGPVLTDLKGSVEFDRAGVTSGELNGRAYGGEFQTIFVAVGTQGNQKYNGKASGTVDLAELKQVLGPTVVRRIHGTTDWEAHYKIEGGSVDIEITSSLHNITVDLPEPFLKTPSDVWPFVLTIQTQDGNFRTTSLALGDKLKGTATAVREDNQWKITSGVFGTGTAPPTVEPGMTGLHVNANLTVFDYDLWKTVFTRTGDRPEGLSFGEIQSVSANFDELILARQRSIRSAAIDIQRLNTHLQVQIDSQEIKGVARYRTAEFTEEDEVPSLHAEFSKCHFPEATEGVEPEPANPFDLPELHFTCNNMRYGDYNLGVGKIVGKPYIGGWRIEEAKFESKALLLTANGAWNLKDRQSSWIDFEFSSDAFGDAMSNLGYPGVVEGGTSTLTGKFRWDDALTSWQPSKVSGTCNLNAQQGRLKSIDNPGLDFVGFLNYETLTQRLGMSYDEVGTSGLEFATLGGSCEIENGIISINGLHINGPGAEMLLSGTTDWNSRTHDLKLLVEPKLGKGVTTIATLINPVTGVLTYLGQKFLTEQLPLKIGALYSVTGSWDDPNIEPIVPES